MKGFLFRLDPRTKLLLIPALSLLVFLTDRLIPTFCIMLSFIVLRLQMRIPFKNLRFYIKFLILFTIFIGFMQALFGPGDNYILKSQIFFPFTGGCLSLKWDGFVIAIITGCRIAALFMLLPILTDTTEPYLMALGLTKLGLNYRASYIILATLNLVPFFQESARSIMDAQRLRGAAAFEKGTLRQKLKAYRSLAIPLVLGAMRKAQYAGIAMDSRAFGACRTRTWLTEIKMKREDFLAFAASFVFSAVMLALNFAL